MRRQIPIAHAVYNHLFPHPSPSDPPSFAAHLARNLVPEVRIEVATYYGDLNSVEARYPGLNYCHAPHRMRLGRFKHHRRLFEAFDELDLTYQEIQDFCCWEGSRWARLKYEEDQGEKVIDTTGDEIKPWSDRDNTRASVSRSESITRKTDIEIVFEDASYIHGRLPEVQGPDETQEMPESLPPYDDQLTVLRHESAQRSRSTHSRRILRDINQRALQAWQSGVAVPAEIEALIKEQVENGQMDSSLLQILTTARANAHRARHASRRHTGATSPSAAWNYEALTAP